METATHRGLKVTAARVLLNAGCVAAATEVLCPIARHRVDAAGYLDPCTHTKAACTPALLERGENARTIIIECKQSRSDFVKDNQALDRLLAQRAKLHADRVELEDRIVKICEPGLRVGGSSLFPDLEAWDFSQSRVESYRRLVLEIAGIDKRIHGSSKFWRMTHYRLANAMYIAAPAGMLGPHELPMHWGLIEVARQDVTNPAAWSVTQPATPLQGRQRHRTRMLRNIAVAACRGLRASAQHDHEPRA